MSDYPPFVTPGPRHGFFAEPDKSTPDPGRTPAPETRKPSHAGGTPPAPLNVIQVAGYLMAREQGRIELVPFQRHRFGVYVRRIWVPYNDMVGQVPLSTENTGTLTFPKSFWMKAASKRRLPRSQRRKAAALARIGENPYGPITTNTGQS